LETAAKFSQETADEIARVNILDDLMPAPGMNLNLVEAAAGYAQISRLIFQDDDNLAQFRGYQSSEEVTRKPWHCLGEIVEDPVSEIRQSTMHIM